jgi:hypothetical protein
LLARNFTKPIMMMIIMRHCCACRLLEVCVGEREVKGREGVGLKKKSLKKAKKSRRASVGRRAGGKEDMMRGCGRGRDRSGGGREGWREGWRRQGERERWGLGEREGGEGGRRDGGRRGGRW